MKDRRKQKNKIKAMLEKEKKFNYRFITENPIKNFTLKPK